MSGLKVIFFGMLLILATGGRSSAESYRVVSEYEVNGLYDYCCMVQTTPQGSEADGKYIDTPMPVYRLPGTDYYIGYRGCYTKWVIINLPDGPTSDRIGGGPGYGLIFMNDSDTPLPPRTGWRTGSHNTEYTPPSEVIPVFYLFTTVIGTNCTVTRSPSADRYDDGTHVTLTANAASHWVFSAWSGGLSGSTNPVTITMNADTTIVATFVGLADCDLLTHVEGQGSIALDPPDGSYINNTTVTLNAIPASSYWRFDGWSGALTGDDNPALLLMDGDKSITASFSLADTDGDGMSDQDEDQGDNNGDANRDGTPDRLQANVVNLQIPESQNRITLVSEAGTNLQECAAVANPHPEDCPEWVGFPYGFLSFSITGLSPGAAATIAIYLPDIPGASDPDTYYKYGPMYADPVSQWYRFEFENSTGTGAQFDSGTIILHLIDGALGDDDLTANGVIVDVGGPGAIIAQSTGDNGNTPPPSTSTPEGGPDGPIGGCFIQTLFSCK